MDGTITGQRAQNLRRAISLEYFTIGYNVVEAAVGLTAGLLAGSTALLGFALDSLIESSSGAVLLWRLRTEEGGRRDGAEIETKAARFVGFSFLALAAYIAVQATVDLLSQSRSEESPLGIALAVVSLIVMPLLARSKQRVAIALDSRSLSADSLQTWLCTYLSAVLLVGLALNSLGWWWADPVAALAISAVAANEARELLGKED